MYGNRTGKPVVYPYDYSGSGRVWVEIFGAGPVRVRVASLATGTGRVAKMVDPHTPSNYYNGITAIPQFL